ncbi:PAS domain S-box-containing protein [Xaviernesmea oryzae]|nr:PAS domain S-box-containing protein [Xaviernesmea oryzae]
MHRAILAHDWDATPLGARDTWTPVLIHTLGLALASPIPMALIWGDDNILLHNDAFADLAGDTLLGSRARDIWHELTGLSEDALCDCLAGKARGLESTRSPRIGAALTIDCSPVPDGTGAVAGALVMLRQKEQQQDAERIQLALSAGAIIGTWFWDLPTDRFTVDEAFARSFGLDPARGRSGLSLAQVVETVHPDDQAGLAEAIGAAIARGGAYAHQYRVRRHDGQYYWLEANGRVDHAPDGTPLRFPGVLIDMEERRALLQERDRAFALLRALNETLEQRVADRTTELMRAEEALRQSQKMEAVGQLTGGLAHDFNNLLAGISGSLELMAARIAQGRVDELGRYVDAAQGAAKRAAALTHRLLAFSRRQTLEPKPTDISRLVAGIEDLIRRTVGPGISMETESEATLWPTLVDQNQLENALLNLCINARDAMPNGGRITILTSNTTLEADSAKALELPPGDYVVMRVTDTGTGMSADLVERAFDPFFTTKPIGVGTGLGLSMTYGFVRQSGGQVRIRSAVGHGTTVEIYLPVHGEALAQIGQDTVLEPSQPAKASKTVLVVDDEPIVRMLIVDVMEELGYRVLEAGDGPQATVILNNQGPLDLLITDVGLPNGMNGRQVADAARTLWPDLPVLFVTGYAETAVLSHGHLKPGMQILTKPFTIEALTNKVAEALAAAEHAARQEHM